jgi:hypothetical protein
LVFMSACILSAELSEEAEVTWSKGAPETSAGSTKVGSADSKFD